MRNAADLLGGEVAFGVIMRRSAALSLLSEQCAEAVFRSILNRRAEWEVMDGLSSELLGFPPDARVLIVNCDDFGMHAAINAAVVESIEHGSASSCSLMVPCPAAREAMRLLREHRQISFGIHLALICDWPEYR